MKKQLKYLFNYIDRCNMCHSKSDTHRVMGKRLNQSQGKNPKRKIGISTTILKCSNCGLIYSNPQPIPFDLQDHYGIPPEDYWHEVNFKVDKNYYQNEIDKVKKMIGFTPGMKFLDIGAGIGKTVIALENAGFDAYGLEPSVAFHKRAISRVGVSSDKIKLGKLEEVEYEESSFDYILLGAVLEHLYDPSLAILKAMKWLKPNGVIQIEVPSSDWLINKMINLYYFIKCTDYVGNISPMHVPYHLYEFSLKSFKEHAKRHNYVIAFYEYYVCRTYMPKIFDYMLKRYMRWTNTGMELNIYLKRH